MVYCGLRKATMNEESIITEIRDKSITRKERRRAAALSLVVIQGMQENLLFSSPEETEFGKELVV